MGSLYSNGMQPQAATSSAAPSDTKPAGFLGIVMLDTVFPRPPGDVGNPDTWGVPTRRVVLRGAWPERVVQSAAGLRREKLVEPFKKMVRQLASDGATAITTSCGFLVLLQTELQSAAPKLPVVTSSLLQLPALLRAHAQVGVLTISARTLGLEHLRAAGVARERLGDVLIQGVAADSSFTTAILGNRAEMDLTAAQADVVAAATALKTRAPHLTQLVLECTNMPPYAAAIEAATGLKTWSLLQAAALLKPFATNQAS